MEKSGDFSPGIRVIYLDAILFLGRGIIGTGHHGYWTGQSNIPMALAAVFSAMEVVPLTLLTLDAWDFIKLTRGKCDICGKEISIPHEWIFYFLMAVGFWNFVGAGIFGFPINIPIVNYFELGTNLTPNHGRAAMMGVFGMLAISFMVLAIRQVLADAEWQLVKRYIRVSFWGMNIGLALMVLFSLFPGGLLQFLDVLKNSYWHARSPEFLDKEIVRLIEWLRMPADLIFILGGFADPNCDWTSICIFKRVFQTRLTSLSLISIYPFHRWCLTCQAIDTNLVFPDH